MKKIIVVCICALFVVHVFGQEYGNRMSSLYFGPNAMPVPDMLDGTVSENLYAELAYDYYAGKYGDYTQDIFALIRIPAFSPRINLSLWMPVVEFYRNTSQSIAHQQPREIILQGYEFGNVYITADIYVFSANQAIAGCDLACRVNYSIRWG